MHLQLFISHNRGCQYYIGEYDRARNIFNPLQHGRMTWNDALYFAPEALIDGKGRQIMWAYNEQDFGPITIGTGQRHELSGINGESCEIQLTIDRNGAEHVGLLVRTSPNGEECTRLYFDAAAQLLVFDSVNSGTYGMLIKEEAPLQLLEGEKLELTVFIDKSVIEIFANDRQAISRRVYPGGAGSTRVYLFAEQGECIFSDVKVWEMSPSNAY